MPLRPIDAIFVHPQQRFYVVYYRGELWQLPRMKIDMTSWQNRKPYQGEKRALYLTQSQQIADLTLAAQLRTLQLPDNIHGCHLPKFEDWWETHGYTWLKNKLLAGESPLAGNAMLTANAADTSIKVSDTSRATVSVTSDLNTTAQTTTADTKKSHPVDVNRQTSHEAPTPTKSESVQKQPTNTARTDTNTQKQDTQEKPDTQTDKVTSASPASTVISEEVADNIFDDMLAELTNDILNGE